MTDEHIRLEEARTGDVPWKKLGPWLSERQWGTVREDSVRAVMHGTSSLTIKHVRAPIDGVRMVWQEFQMKNRAFVFQLHSGMEKTAF